jgi:single-strand DNA-binding protein
MSVNKAILLGRLGKDPEVKTFEGGNSVTNFSLATSKRYKDKNGEKQEKTEWHNIAAWGALGEICAKYLTKGSQVYLEGEINTRKWEDKEGVTRYSTEIVMSEMTMLGGKTEAPQKEYKMIDKPDETPEQDLPF